MAKKFHVMKNLNIASYLQNRDFNCVFYFASMKC